MHFSCLGCCCQMTSRFTSSTHLHAANLLRDYMGGTASSRRAVLADELLPCCASADYWVS